MFVTEHSILFSPDLGAVRPSSLFESENPRAQFANGYFDISISPVKSDALHFLFRSGRETYISPETIICLDKFTKIQASNLSNNRMICLALPNKRRHNRFPKNLKIVKFSDYDPNFKGQIDITNNKFAFLLGLLFLAGPNKEGDFRFEVLNYVYSDRRGYSYLNRVFHRYSPISYVSKFLQRNKIRYNSRELTKITTIYLNEHPLKQVVADIIGEGNNKSIPEEFITHMPYVWQVAFLRGVFSMCCHNKNRYFEALSDETKKDFRLLKLAALDHSYTTEATPFVKNRGNWSIPRDKIKKITHCRGVTGYNITPLVSWEETGALNVNALHLLDRYK